MSEPLAIDGGRPLRTSPLPPWPVFDEDEVAAAAEVLRSGKVNYWTGTEGKFFESEYAEMLGRTHGIALANGTVALELALRAFRVGPGDEVIVPARTFIATASSVVAVGATPVVADIEPLSGNITAETVEAALTERTRAVIPVHFGGWPVDMAPLVELAHARQLIVIEDCAQAHGGTYRGAPCGNLGSHAAAFSFCQDKNLPLGEGGLLVLDDTAAYERAWSYKDHGKSLPKVLAEKTEDTFCWLHDDFGTNWRMHEVAAAVGRVMMQRLPEWHEARTRNALRLASGLASLPGLTVPLPPAGIDHAFYRLYAFADPAALASDWTRDRIIAAVKAEGVPCMYGGCAEIYRERAFSAMMADEHTDRLPGAAFAHERSVAFLVHPTLSEADIDDTAAAVAKVWSVAAR